MSRSLSLRAAAVAIWQAAVEAVDPERLVHGYVRTKGRKLLLGEQILDLEAISRIVVVGAGKAGAAMSRGVEDALGDELLEKKQVEGFVNVPADCVVPLKRITLHAARQPGENRPTAAGVEGARRIVSLVRSAGPEDVCLCLLSGGGSALLPLPVEGVSLEDKQRVTELLHECGATINELNAVRKHLSQVKGGRLAAGFRGRLLASLIISDVVGDPLDVIASGPTAGDRSTFHDALAVLERYDAAYQLLSRTPPSVVDYLRRGAAGQLGETPNRVPRGVINSVIGNNALALAAAARQARQLGYQVINLSSAIEGESREVGVVLAGIARGIRDSGQPIKPPACVLSGGETTVSLVREHGLGGRNQELVLAALEKLREDGMREIAVLSGGTDGEDGPTDAAGAVADAGVIKESARRGLAPRSFLARNDSYHFFEPLGVLIKTGPTHTNVMDVRVVLVGAAK